MDDEPTLFDDDFTPEPFPPVLGDQNCLAGVQDWLRDNIEPGVDCPCCGQLVKLYPRPIHKTMARGLIMMYRAAPVGEWVYMPDVLRPLGRSRGGDEAKLAYWGLIEHDDGVREDGSKRTGWWRVTEKGRLFVRGAVSVPKFARVFNGRCLRFDGEQVHIWDALQSLFDYNELMHGEA